MIIYDEIDYYYAKTSKAYNTLLTIKYQIGMVGHVDLLLLPISHLPQLIRIWEAMAPVYQVVALKVQVR